MKIALLGDLSANDVILARIRHGEARSLTEPLEPLLAECDLVVANLEACICPPGAPREGRGLPKIRIRTEECVREVLERLNVSLVGVANNHSFDYGEPGWVALAKAVGLQGIVSVGGGANSYEASRPAIWEKDGTRVAVLAYADRDCGAVYAAPHSAGVNALDIDRAVCDVSQVRASCHYVVVSVHWGEERIHMPSPKIRQWAQQLARAGADVIHGHHPHVLQGYERIGSCHVFYSLGNFLMADIVNNGRKVVRFCAPNYWSAIPILVAGKQGHLQLQRIVGLHSTNYGRMIVPKGALFRRKWERLCSALDSRDYPRRFFRHQDYMWRYYIPIRYQLMTNPWSLLARLRPEKLARLTGVGVSPWQQRSVAEHDPSVGADL